METVGALKYSCTMCTKSCQTRSSLFRHILTQHTLERPYRCFHCKSDFNDRSHLRDHILRRHPIERNTSEGRDSVEGPTAKRPSQKHDMRGYLCELSNQDVSHSVGLQCTHPGCYYMAISNPDLKRHMAVHSPDRPFGCSKCSSRFKEKNHLCSHLLHAHSTERPFGCTKCSSRFKSKDHLRGHLRHVHSPERPFACSMCSLRFKSNSERRRHVRNVHSPERPFACSTCSFRSKRKDGLRNHLSQVHSIADADFFLEPSGLLSC